MFDENGGKITWSEDNKPIKLLSSDSTKRFELNVDYLKGDNDVPLYYVNKRAFFDGEGDIIDKAINDIKVKKQPEEYDGDVYYVSSIDNSLVKLSDDLKGKKILSDVSDLKTAMNVSGDYLLYAGEGGEIILKEELNPNKADVEVSILALEPVTFKRGGDLMTKGSGKYMLNVFCAYNSPDFKADDTKYNLILGTVNPDDRITFDGTSTTLTYCPIGVNYGSARFTNIIVCNSNSSGNSTAGMTITGKTELINCTFKDNFDNTNTPDSIGVLRVNSPGRVLFENLVFENNKHSTPQGISREVFDIRFTNLGDTDTFIFKGTINGKAYYYGSDENFKKTTVITDGLDTNSKINLSFYSGTSISIVPGYSNPTN
ncbi:MAG: hypothetical protein MJ176_00770 [Treponema sp.]|nr:hypothetical protein [Treponema sp.]